jgi:hypothetical protein
MATARDTRQDLLPDLTNAIPSAWLERFTARQREELLHDDRFAGTAIAIILVSIFVVGLVLSAVAVVLSP